MSILSSKALCDFVKASGKGPLFYNESQEKHRLRKRRDPTNPKRPRAVKARERMAAWVREIGVTDPELQPNHAWRHTFKKIGDRAGHIGEDARHDLRPCSGHRADANTARRTFPTRRQRYGDFHVSRYKVGAFVSEDW